MTFFDWSTKCFLEVANEPLRVKYIPKYLHYLRFQIRYWLKLHSSICTHITSLLLPMLKLVSIGH